MIAEPSKHIAITHSQASQLNCHLTELDAVVLNTACIFAAVLTEGTLQKNSSVLHTQHTCQSEV